MQKFKTGQKVRVVGRNIIGVITGGSMYKKGYVIHPTVTFHNGRDFFFEQVPRGWRLEIVS